MKLQILAQAVILAGKISRFVRSRQAMPPAQWQCIANNHDEAFEAYIGMISN